MFDTNVWISFLIGKRLDVLQSYLASGKITIIITDQLLDEIKIVTNREKLRKYFPQQSVLELIEILKAVAENVEIQPTYFINRDPKDNFLLDLIDFSRAEYLV
ncbi:putative toxin-antitoxin system toxin component, PIN family, partial [bacterium]